MCNHEDSCFHRHKKASQVCWLNTVFFLRSADKEQELDLPSPKDSEAGSSAGKFSPLPLTSAETVLTPEDNVQTTHSTQV